MTDLHPVDQCLGCVDIFTLVVGQFEKRRTLPVVFAGLAIMMGLEDVSAVTPAMLAVQVCD